MDEISNLRGIRDSMRVLSDKLPARTSIKQALAFLFVASAHFEEREVIMRDVVEYLDGDGSMANTFDIFLNFDPKAVGWVEQVSCKEDRRKKLLKLTPLGVDVMKSVVDVMKRVVGRVDEND